MWDPAELLLAAHCVRWVSVKGPHEEGRFRLTCCLTLFVPYGGGEEGTIVPHGWHTIVAAMVELIIFIFLLLLTRTLKKIYPLLVLLLARCA
jgi:hypothetical protein